MLRLLQRRFLPQGARYVPRELPRIRVAAFIGCTYRESSSSTFVSKHHVLQPNNVTAFLDYCGLQFKMFGREVVVKECPFCHDTAGKPDNLWKLYIALDKGCVCTASSPELLCQISDVLPQCINPGCRKGVTPEIMFTTSKHVKHAKQEQTRAVEGRERASHTSLPVPGGRCSLVPAKLN